MSCEGFDYNRCAGEPWLECCTPCQPPGGGGLLRLVPSYVPRPMMLGDHGEFASWETGLIVAATILKIHPDATVDLKLEYANGGWYVVEEMRVAHSLAEWNHYLQDREHYLPMRRDALKAAYDEWNALGQQNLGPVYHDGMLYVSDYFGADCQATIHETLPCGSLNLRAHLRRRNGELNFDNVRRVTAKELGTWQKARELWVPIRQRHLLVADAEIAAYQNGGYIG